MNATCDAIIIGAGPAGSAGALLLARAGWSVALVERKSFPRRKVCGEYLSASNLPLFDCLGIGEHFRAMAGPPVNRVGLYAGKTIVHADLPRPTGRSSQWGRALAREHLDTWLRDQACSAGVETLQPWTVDALVEEAGNYRCTARSLETGATAVLSAPLVIAAHGSWDSGNLPTHIARTPLAPTDLLAFKAHFAGADLPAGLMPLLAFPGGYGGMAHCDAGRVSLSCCIRRDRLAWIRERSGEGAGEAVLAHIQDSCLGVRQVLTSARRDGAWLAAGPIKPGIRVDSRRGLFLVGNAAGEAHPVVAEGISMALQSSWLLAERLIAWKRSGACRAALADVQTDYAFAWRKSFAPRVWASRAIAHWAMRSALLSLSLPFVRCFPSVLSLGAHFSGKANVTRRFAESFCN